MRAINSSLQRAFRGLANILFVIICMIFASSAWAKVLSPASNQPNAITDAQKPIVLHKSNRTFQIVLKSNPTTGYIWALNQFDALSVTPTKRVYHAPALTNSKGQTIVGAPGYEAWSFTLNKSAMKVPRLMKITFCMIRPWTISCDIKKTFTVIYVDE